MKKNLLTIVLALVAMCANAQDKVSTATTWDFESYQSGTTISNEIKSINGLYVRGAAGEGHDIIAEIHKRNGKFADGTAWKTRMTASVNGNGSLNVLMSPRKAVDDRELFLIFDAQVVATGDASEDKVYELTYKADKPGTFWFGADCQYFVYQVKFTPAQ